MIERRKFLLGLGSLIAAPAIVRAASLMPVKALLPLEFLYETYTYWYAPDGFFYTQRVIARANLLGEVSFDYGRLEYVDRSALPFPRRAREWLNGPGRPLA